MKAQDKKTIRAYEVALRHCPQHLVNAMKAVFAKALREKLTYEAAAAALGTAEAWQAAQYLRRILSYPETHRSDYLERRHDLYVKYSIDYDYDEETENYE
jgi:hypothetical protein